MNRIGNNFMKKLYVIMEFYFDIVGFNEFINENIVIF